MAKKDACEICCLNFKGRERKRVECKKCSFGTCATCVVKFQDHREASDQVAGLYPECMECSYQISPGEFTMQICSKGALNKESISLKNQFATNFALRVRNVISAQERARIAAVQHRANLFTKMMAFSQAVSRTNANIKAHIDSITNQTGVKCYDIPSADALCASASPVASRYIRWLLVSELANLDTYRTGRQSESLTFGEIANVIIILNEMNIKLNGVFTNPNSFPSTCITWEHFLPENADKAFGSQSRVVYILPPSSNFVCKCVRTGCLGSMTRDDAKLRCQTCDEEVCGKCREKHSDECDPDILKSVKELEKTTKPCPNCKAPIFRISGCPDMACTSCFTCFNWNTGKIDVSGNSNPHYQQWMRNRRQTSLAYNTASPPATREEELVYDLILRTASSIQDNATLVNMFPIVAACITAVSNLTAAEYVENMALTRYADNISFALDMMRVACLVGAVTFDELVAVSQKIHSASLFITEMKKVVHNLFNQTLAIAEETIFSGGDCIAAMGRIITAHVAASQEILGSFSVFKTIGFAIANGVFNYEFNQNSFPNPIVVWGAGWFKDWADPQRYLIVSDGQKNSSAASIHPFMCSAHTFSHAEVKYDADAHLKLTQSVTEWCRTRYHRDKVYSAERLKFLELDSQKLLFSIGLAKGRSSVYSMLYFTRHDDHASHYNMYLSNTILRILTERLKA